MGGVKPEQIVLPESKLLAGDSDGRGIPVELTGDGSVAYNPTDQTLQLTVTDGVTTGKHKTLRQLIHFIDNGPAEGFASGAYRETNFGPFPTSIVWYDKEDDDSVGRKKIVEKLITWVGAFPTVIVWKVYDAEETLLATVTDTITYTGAFETGRVRTIT